MGKTCPPALPRLLGAGAPFPGPKGKELSNVCLSRIQEKDLIKRFRYGEFRDLPWTNTQTAAAPLSPCSLTISESQETYLRPLP